jgi:hypothetical protein
MAPRSLKRNPLNFVPESPLWCSVINAVQTGPGIGVAGLSEVLGLDKGTVRKVALEACSEGELTAQNNGQGYVFFPASNAPALSIADHAYLPPAVTQQLPASLDAWRKTEGAGSTSLQWM